MKLALLGGTPIRETMISYGQQQITQEDVDAVAETLLSPLITTGPRVAEAEGKICHMTGAQFTTLVSSGTAALHIACLAAGITTGDEVIVSSITFAASSNCVLYCGGTPVFADIDPDTWNISVESIKEKLSPRTKAIIAVDFTGQAVACNEISQICKEHNLIFIEDAAHAFGTKYEGRGIGSIADFTTFSFHPVKTVTCGEGGAVCCNDPEYDQKLKLFRSHCITRNPALMQEKNPSTWQYEQLDLGFNYRLTDFQAALLMSQMKRLPDFMASRARIAQTYNAAFSQMPELQIQKTIPQSETSQHLYIIRVVPDTLTASRNTLFDALFAENIGVNIHYVPVYWLPYYEGLGYEKGLCPVAEDYAETAITLPLFPTMTEEDVASVINGVKKVINYYRSVEG